MELKKCSKLYLNVLTYIIQTSILSFNRLNLFLSDCDLDWFQFQKLANYIVHLEKLQKLKFDVGLNSLNDFAITIISYAISRFRNLRSLELNVSTTKNTKHEYKFFYSFN